MTKEQGKIIERCRTMLNTVFSSYNGKIIYTIRPEKEVECTVVTNNVRYPDYINNDSVD